MRRLLEALRALLRPRESEGLREDVSALRAALAASEGACDALEAERAALTRDRDALRAAARELREAVEVRDHALWAAAVLVSRPGVRVPDPGAADPWALVELVAVAARTKWPA